jgi:hypothetical protein
VPLVAWLEDQLARACDQRFVAEQRADRSLQHVAVLVLAGVPVERQTYYRHFPDDRALMQACSGLYL